MPNGRGHSGAGRREGQGGSSRTVQKPRIEYFEAGGSQIRTELLDQEAERVARELSDVAKSQLRRFYNHVQAIDRKLRLEARGGSEKEREAVFARLRPELLMLKAKAFYARGRPSNPIPAALLEFIAVRTDSVKTVRDFEAFRRHFEAVVAFHNFYGRKE
ncbi:MAG TPA: type III-A CRISPR-associated protein Csm2 [Bryobacteraceae bacterium]|nr:type III-A CRISPR-associated protein Csm2 [Bryobacteraceae bacterium]